MDDHDVPRSFSRTDKQNTAPNTPTAAHDSQYVIEYNFTPAKGNYLQPSDYGDIATNSAHI
jgi:hypothetical protein